MPWSMSKKTKASAVAKPKLLRMKNEENYLGFLIPKIWQILKRFSRHFSLSTNPEIVKCENI